MRLKLNVYWHPGKCALLGFLSGAGLFIAEGLDRLAKGQPARSPSLDLGLFLLLAFAATVAAAGAAWQQNRRVVRRTASDVTDRAEET